MTALLAFGLMATCIASAGAELAETLADIEAMAYLGEYYADKILGATDLAGYRKTKDSAMMRRSNGERSRMNIQTPGADSGRVLPKIGTYAPITMNRPLQTATGDLP